MGYELVTTSPRCYKLSEVVSESVSKRVSQSVGKSITRCIHYVEYATQVRDELNYISTYYSLRKVERTLVVNHTIRLRHCTRVSEGGGDYLLVGGLVPEAYCRAYC